MAIAARVATIRIKAQKRSRAMIAILHWNGATPSVGDLKWMGRTILANRLAEYKD
jgi:hypothetical protein